MAFLKKRFFIVVCSMFYSLISFSQGIDAEKEYKIIEHIEDTERAIFYTDSILSYNFPKKDTIIILNGYNFIKANKLQKAETLFKNFIHRNKNKNSYNLAESYIGYAQATTFLGNKAAAIKATIKALDIAKKLNNKTLEAEAISILGVVYFTFSDYQAAINHSKKAIDIHEKMDATNTKSIAPLYNNIAICFDKMNQLDSARHYIYKTLDVNKSDRGRSMIYGNLGLNYHKKKQYYDAILHYEKSITIHEKIKSNNTTSYSNLAHTYLELNDFEKAKKYYKLALVNSEIMGNSKIIERSYSDILKLAIKEKDFDNSILYLTKRDSIHQINVLHENEDKLRLLKTQFNQTKKEELFEQKLALNKMNIIILITFSILLLFLSLYIAQNNKNKQLHLTKEKLELEQKVLRTQMNPHFIFNVLTTIQKNLLDDDLIKTSTSLAKFAKVIRKNFEFTNRDKISLFEDLDALKNYIDIQQMRFDNTFDYYLNVQEKINTQIIEIPPMLLQPFVENAIEHGLKPSNKRGLLIINIKKSEPKTLLFEIIDNGIGLNFNKEKDDREHAIDIFLKRLKLRGLNESNSFKMENIEEGGTITSFMVHH